MKKIGIYILAFSFIGSISSCTKTDNNSAKCSNHVLDTDIGETEIDCGGSSCQACPPAGTVTATITGSAFMAKDLGGIASGVGMRIYGVSSNAIMQFIFRDYVINQPQALSIGTLTYGDPHMMQPGDTGT